MTQLDATKLTFLFCVGICIFICTFIYIKAKFPKEPFHLNEILATRAECGHYPDEICSALFEGKEAAAKLGTICQKTYGPQVLYTNNPVNCSNMIRKLHFITSPLSKEEANYSLAYIITIHKELDMFVMLLRAIYAPQNIYCVHIDEKSSNDYKNAVRNLVACFNNIFISSKTEPVVYAGFSRLQADINCMKDLIHSQVQWKNVINLCGQDYPIKTNKEIINYIKTKWNGKNVTPGTTQPAHMRHRTQFSYKEFIGPGKSYVYQTQNQKGVPPQNLTIYFGTAYYILTRKFVEFVLEDVRAEELLIWSKDTYSPDEHYWVTLNRLKDAPGATPNAEWDGNIRAIKWRNKEGVSHDGCKGQYVRDICVYGLGDMKWLAQSQHLFANKFEASMYPLAIQCFEHRHRLRVLQGAEVPIKSDWYLQENIDPDK
ncbi:beta-1,3-galactosyl-O-glycosyl-glycoprotein beta-1,6-N-acetylglucosaminyltransferase 7 [Latimeria chalumnae]|uniref:beta-1,3-galactosyl-O-glycosyl-glycoprotein beta-1,6-N-acetylglucosaminyltransferase 7 n=1 Tax=Latimeria chalumnae TaxID=7897 RepID=UPI0003C17A6D|nr:PREDICTED: beta-1,3-galactosyl-O-glycosyl-glycoprotein beta-1,6-N-acetylglucosaminyltransferase 7 [Latimeria chalumnae]|eukprot:XP_005990639.1 PREDICTED: beta-1,3-galactosyl-O-glycosyl-glycoprotein beta-1,6-N-acetylglucosaminyltransferase 7 [Latimeria chalumnae]